MSPREELKATTTSFEWEEIRRHDKVGDAWVVLGGAVYNVSNFLKDHPGGNSIVLPHLGGDIEEVFADEDYHCHSKSAYKILEQYRIGHVAGATVVSLYEKAPGSVGGEGGGKARTGGGFPEGKTDIDWTKPIVFQVGELGRNYNDFVHSPKVMDEPARFFASDFLEPFSRTPWYVVPSVWVPVIAVMLAYSCKIGLTPYECAATFVGGIGVWTLLEYVLHRFIFHLDEWVQFSYWSITLHFLLHGVHHKLPQDPMRLVMPPTITTLLLIPIHYMFRFFLPVPEAIAITAGGLAGYIGYDLTHYYLHHAGIKPTSYIGQLKRYHLAHHYQNPKLGFGITSKFWDHAFGTVLPVKAVKDE